MVARQIIILIVFRFYIATIGLSDFELTEDISVIASSEYA